MSTRSIVLIIISGLMALIGGVGIGLEMQQSNTTPVVQTIPWYCQSMDNMKAFQDANPSVGVYCTNNVPQHNP